MRVFVASVFFCLCLTNTAFARDDGGPDSVRICTLNGCGYINQASASKFGTYTPKEKKQKKKTVIVDGKKFTPTPGTVSHHSNAAPWLAEAQRHVGRGNPTGRRSLWCARFINDALARTGHRGTGSDLARSFAHYGRRLHAPLPGAIAIYSRGRNSGHVAIVESVNGGTVTLVSGNCGRAGVCRYTRSSSAAVAYVWPG